VARTTTRNLQIVLKGEDRLSPALKKANNSSRMLKASLVAVAAAGAGMLVFTRKAVKMSLDQATINERLRLSIEKTGQAFSDVAKDIDDFAAGLQDTTRFGDDETKRVLTTLTSLTGSYGEHTKIAAKAVIDFAEGSGKELAPAAALVSQAIAGNISALTRYIPSLRGMKAETFAALDVQERTKIVVDALGGAFGGMAEAIDPAALAFARLSTKAGDVMEAFGDALRESGSLKTGVDVLQSGLVELETWAQNNATTIGVSFNTALIAAATLMRGAAIPLKGLIQMFTLLGETAGPVMSALGKTLEEQSAANLLAGPFAGMKTLFDLSKNMTLEWENLADGVSSADRKIEAIEGTFGAFDDTLSGVVDGLNAYTVAMTGAFNAPRPRPDVPAAPPAPAAPAAPGGGGGAGAGVMEFDPLDLGGLTAAQRARNEALLGGVQTPMQFESPELQDLNDDLSSLNDASAAATSDTDALAQSLANAGAAMIAAGGDIDKMAEVAIGALTQVIATMVPGGAFIAPFVGAIGGLAMKGSTVGGRRAGRRVDRRVRASQRAGMARA